MATGYRCRLLCGPRDHCSRRSSDVTGRLRSAPTEEDVPELRRTFKTISHGGNLPVILGNKTFSPRVPLETLQHVLGTTSWDGQGLAGEPPEEDRQVWIQVMTLGKRRSSELAVQISRDAKEWTFLPRMEAPAKRDVYEAMWHQLLSLRKAAEDAGSTWPDDAGSPWPDDLTWSALRDVRDEEIPTALQLRQMAIDAGSVKFSASEGTVRVGLAADTPRDCFPAKFVGSSKLGTHDFFKGKI